MDLDTFFSRVRRFLIELLKKESRTGAIRTQTMTWIRLRKDNKFVELAFNSRMANVYNLSDMNEIVNEMIAHMKQVIEIQPYRIVDSYLMRSHTWISISVD